jgi:hypothetical protein
MTLSTIFHLCRVAAVSFIGGGNQSTSWRKISAFPELLTNLIIYNILFISVISFTEGRRGRDHIVVGLTTTYAISAYHQ